MPGLEPGSAELIYRQVHSSEDAMKTGLVFLLSLMIAIVLPNPVWAHGGGGDGGDAGGGGAGGGGGSSSSAGGGGGGGGSSSAGGGGGTPDGRSFSNHTHAQHSLAQDHLAHITKADQAVQVDDKGPGKTKGFVDSLPPNQELQADRSVTLNPETIHSDLDDVVALGLHPNQEPNLDRGRTLNLEMIHLDPEDFATLGLQSGQELQDDGGRKLSPDTIHSELDDTVTKGLPPVLALNLARLDALFLQTDDTPATTFSHRDALDDIRAKMLPPTSPELDDDDATGWKLVPFYGLLLVFLIAIVFSRQGILRVFQRDTLRQPPNALA